MDTDSNLSDNQTQQVDKIAGTKEHIPPTRMEKLAYALLKILEDRKDKGSHEAAEIEAAAFEKVFGYDKTRE